MKKKVLPFIGLLLISVLSATVLSSCDKDTWCYLEVTVLDSKNDNKPVPGAWIRVRYIKNNPDNPDNPVFGTIDTITQCDASGVARTKLALLPSSPSLPALTNPIQLTTNSTTAKANAPSASNPVKW